MNNSKICFKCNETLPLTDFYKHKGMADGHLGKCKECAKREERERRLQNIDYCREYDKNRSNLPHRVDARLKYQQTEEGKKNSRKAKEKWQIDNVIKRSASHIVNNAVRDGKITKPSECSVCGLTTRIHGHHDDYNYPMIVRWMCSKCHCLWHK
jgi:ribosomal protein S27AE